MFSTDVDEKNIEYARENVAKNGLKSRVRIVKTTQEDPLIPLKTISVERYVHGLYSENRLRTVSSSVLTSSCAILLSTHLKRKCCYLQRRSPDHHSQYDSPRSPCILHL